MIAFRFDTFKGVRPRVRPRLLPPNEAQTALDCRLGSGAIEPWNEPVEDTAASNSQVSSIYRMRNGGSPIWLESSNDVDWTPGPVPDDTLEKIYYTGEAQPRMTYIGLAETSAPYPDDYRYLGIPAPSSAPTLSGASVPSSSVTGSTDTGGIQTNYLNADIAIDQNLPANLNCWYLALTSGGVPSDNGYEPTATARTFAFSLPVGTELRVTEVVDSDNVKFEDANGKAYIAAGTDDTAYPNGQTWFRTDDTGTTRAAYFRFYLPNDTAFQITSHNLELNDVVRITEVAEPVAITFTQPSSIDSSSGVFFGAESDNGAGTAGSNTWRAAPVSVGVDDFYRQPGATAYPFEEIWAEASGPAGADFGIDGVFSYELIGRGGVDYSDTVSDVESRVYVFTYVSDLGEEGPPSPASAIVTIPTGGQVDITQTGSAPSTQRQIDNWRIYRANTGDEVTDFQFVAEVAIGTSPYSDTISDIDLGEVLQTTTWDPPPTGLTGIVTGPNGMLAGFSGKDLYICEPFYPHAWPPEYKQTVEHDIVGVGVLPNGFAILTKGTPYACIGDHPSAMSLSRFEFQQACVSKRSIVNTLDSVLYASPDGLCEIGARGFKVVTRNLMTKREWQVFEPTTIVGAWHDSKYFGFHASAGFVYDPSDESIGFTTVSDTVGFAFVDPEEDVLYTLPTIDVTLYDFTTGVPSGWTTYQNMAFTVDEGGSENNAFSNATNNIPSVYVDDDISGLDPTNVAVQLSFAWPNEGNHGAGRIWELGLIDDTSSSLRPEWLGITFRLAGSGLLSARRGVSGATSDSNLTNWNFSSDVVTLDADEDDEETTYSVKFTISGSTMTLYFDGEQKGQFTLSAGEISAISGATKVGVLMDRTSGLEDDVRLYSIATGAAADDLDASLSINEWDASAGAARAFTWKSGVLKADYPCNLGAARIVSATYPVTLNIWDEEGTNVVSDRSVTSDDVIRLPGGYLSGTFEIQVAGDDTLEMVHVAETVAELEQG